MPDQPERFGPQAVTAPASTNTIEIVTLDEAGVPTDHAVPECEHIKFNGDRCGSPAMRGKHFCYHHSRIRHIRPDEALPTSDSPEAIVYSAQAVIDNVLAGKLDYKPALAIAALLRVQNAALPKFRMPSLIDPVLEDSNDKRYSERLNALPNTASTEDILEVVTDRVKFG
jgi:hypothetical protein